jgi:hypothetical protein
MSEPVTKSHRSPRRQFRATFGSTVEVPFVPEPPRMDPQTKAGFEDLVRQLHAKLENPTASSH